MRNGSIGTSGSPSSLARWTGKPSHRIRAVVALAALLPLIAAAAEGQSEDADPPPPGPGQSGLGRAAPWSVEGTPETPKPRPHTEDRDRDQLDELWSRMEKRPSELRCRILELEELGRFYVEDVSGVAGGDPYWLQLPKGIKIVAESPARFGGRKKLKLEDLDVGQLLIITLRQRDGEMVKVRVRAPKA